MNSLRTSLSVLILGATALAFAGSSAKSSEMAPTSPAVSSTEINQQWMIEGEKRYRANCGRCHQPPHKFPPRTMATAIRHMRVRAMLTDDDVKYVLYFMSH
jgi:cytochrome c5